MTSSDNQPITLEMLATPSIPAGSTTPKDDAIDLHNMPLSAIAVFVLAVLCLLVGILYAYLYCTRMNPRLRGAAKFGDSEGDNQRTTTHLLLFKKT
jgi:hypothetical protein